MRSVGAMTRVALLSHEGRVGDRRGRSFPRGISSHLVEHAHKIVFSSHCAQGLCKRSLLTTRRVALDAHRVTFMTHHRCSNACHERACRMACEASRSFSLLNRMRNSRRGSCVGAPRAALIERADAILFGLLHGVGQLRSEASQPSKCPVVHIRRSTRPALTPLLIALRNLSLCVALRKAGRGRVARRSCTRNKANRRNRKDSRCDEAEDAPFFSQVLHDLPLAYG